MEGELTVFGEETLVVSVTGLILVKGHKNPLLNQERQRRTDGRVPHKDDNLKGESLTGLCDFWHPSVHLDHKSESGCKYCKFLRWRKKDRWLY